MKNTKLKKLNIYFLFDAEDKLLGDFNFSFLNGLNLDLISFSFTNSIRYKLPLYFEIKSKECK